MTKKRLTLATVVNGRVVSAIDAIVAALLDLESAARDICPVRGLGDEHHDLDRITVQLRGVLDRLKTQQAAIASGELKPELDRPVRAEWDEEFAEEPPHAA